MKTSHICIAIMLAIGIFFLISGPDTSKTVDQKVAEAEAIAAEDTMTNFVDRVVWIPCSLTLPSSGRKWQYVSIDMEGYSAEKDSLLLNKMDAKGWELSSTIYASYIFKRPFPQ